MLKFNVSNEECATPKRVKVMVIAVGHKPSSRPKHLKKSNYKQFLKTLNETKKIAFSGCKDADSDKSNGEKGERGYIGLMPRQSSPYYSEVTVPANTMVNFNQLMGNFSVSLGKAVSGYDNEWSFTITQGDVAFDVFLPTVYWGLGIAPTFSANTTTLCRLYYLGTTLCGEWVSI